MVKGAPLVPAPAGAGSAKPAAGLRGHVRPGAAHRGPARPSGRVVFRVATVLLPALVVFAAEVIRHEVLHHLVPEMLGNVITGAAALCISAVILLPVYRRLEAADARLRRSDIEQAVSAERERLARELHDSISQALFFLNVKATALERSLGGGPDSSEARGAAREITQAIQDTSNRVREAIFDLRTSPDPGQPFGNWVRAYAARFGEIHGLAATAEEHGTAVALPLESELHAMAIVREVLHNVAKHARAKAVHTALEWDTGGITLTVADDGAGLPAPVPGPAQGRYGLTAIEEHARAAGGTVAVTRSAGGGTQITFRWPDPHQASARP